MQASVRYRLEKNIPTPYGALAIYGGTYRWRWMARVAKWCAELCPDLRAYRTVEITEVSHAG